MAAIGSVDSRQKCSTCKNRGQKGFEKEEKVRRWLPISLSQTVVWNICPLYGGGEQDMASYMICLGIPYPVMPAWEAPLLLPICRPMTFCPWRSCSSENPLRFCWAFLVGTSEIKWRHMTVSNPSQDRVTQLRPEAITHTSRLFPGLQLYHELWLTMSYGLPWAVTDNYIQISYPLGTKMILRILVRKRNQKPQLPFWKT